MAGLCVARGGDGGVGGGVRQNWDGGDRLYVCHGYQGGGGDGLCAAGDDGAGEMAACADT